MKPSTHGANGNGRDAGGRFGAGNKLGRGNPLAGRVAKLRAVLLKTVTPDDIREIVRALILEAKGGDIAAIREVLDRVLGKPTQAVDLDIAAPTVIDTPPPIPIDWDEVRRLEGIA